MLEKETRTSVAFAVCEEDVSGHGLVQAGVISARLCVRAAFENVEGALSPARNGS
jgi:hypothetical protein